MRDKNKRSVHTYGQQTRCSHHVAGRRTAPGVRESIKECRLKNRGSYDSARSSFDPSTNKVSVDYKSRGNFTERFIILKVGERWMVLV